MDDSWKYRAAVFAPTGPGLFYPDTQVIARNGWYQVITPSAPRGSLNEVVLSEVVEADAEAVIDDVVAMYRAIGQPTKWCVGPWTKPLGFGERLQRRGFQSWAVKGMGCPTDMPVKPSDGVRVVDIDGHRLPEFLAVQGKGWGGSETPSSADVEAHVAALSQAPRVAYFFAAERQGTLVGTSGLFLRDGYGYLLAAQVLAPARGTGAYRAMIAARLAFLARHRISYAVTQARAETSAPILARLGFETLFESRCYRLD